MMDIAGLKSWLHKPGLSRLEKLLVILLSLEGPVSVAQITQRGVEGGFHALKKWNISAILAASSGAAIRTSLGWEITEKGRRDLAQVGLTTLAPAAAAVANDLRNQLSKISNQETQRFVEEAVRAYEYGLYRSAVVMAWLAAVHVLQVHVHTSHLAAFNAEASKVDQKWKPAKIVDDLGRMKEGDFLDRIAAIGVIGKNVKEELKKCLDRRNACGHPNTYSLGANTVAHHIEVLLLNVFGRFA
jgi:hypothetical protein